MGEDEHASNEVKTDRNTMDDVRSAVDSDVAAVQPQRAPSAVDAPTIQARRRQARRWFVVAIIAVVLVGLGSVASVLRLRGADRDHTSTGTPASVLSLSQRVAESARVVVGTVTKVDHGRTNGPVAGETGDPYVLATIRVDEAIKGPGGDLVAFDYTFASATSEGASRAWNVGDHVLLFLVPDVGTVSATIEPLHMQVAEGESGRYFIDGAKLVGADFTLDDVRRLAR
jgi:hypothetical protein